MLSIGMLAARHFSSTIRSRGFMFASPPPIFAAMEISLLSLAKILPRLASNAPLKCLTFAHLLCPAINQTSSQGRLHSLSRDVNEPRRLSALWPRTDKRVAMPVFFVEARKLQRRLVQPVSAQRPL